MNKPKIDIVYCDQGWYYVDLTSSDFAPQELTIARGRTLEIARRNATRVLHVLTKQISKIKDTDVIK